MDPALNTPNQPVRFVYFGTPRFAALALDELTAAGFTPALIVTGPDKPAGRGLIPTPPAVKTWALEHHIPFIQPSSLRELPSELTAEPFDVFIVAAYGKILREDVLSLPRRGCINLHPSLLPRFRGASPIESQILADERPIGVSVMLMDAEMDHGDILAQREVLPREWPLPKPKLTDLLARENGRLLAQILSAYLIGTIVPTHQDHEAATYTKKIEKADGLLNLSAPARENYLKYAAYNGWPGTYFFAKRGEQQVRVKITAAHLENGTFVIDRVIPEGKSEQAFSDFAKKATF